MSCCPQTGLPACESETDRGSCLEGKPGPAKYCTSVIILTETAAGEGHSSKNRKNILWWAEFLMSWAAANKKLYSLHHTEGMLMSFTVLKCF